MIWCIFMTYKLLAIFIYILNIRGSLKKFPDFLHRGTFIDSTHMKL